MYSAMCRGWSSAESRGRWGWTSQDSRPMERFGMMGQRFFDKRIGK
jgi:hypothetical protein